ARFAVLLWMVESLLFAADRHVDIRQLFARPAATQVLRARQSAFGPHAAGRRCGAEPGADRLLQVRRLPARYDRSAHWRKLAGARHIAADRDLVLYVPADRLSRRCEPRRRPTCDVPAVLLLH